MALTRCWRKTAAEKPEHGEIMAVGKDRMDRFTHTQKPLADFRAWACEMVTGDFTCR
jgi:hypothetical protein